MRESNSRPHDYKYNVLRFIHEPGAEIPDDYQAEEEELRAMLAAAGFETTSSYIRISNAAAR